MLNINGFEFILIAIAAMLLLGPKQLASTARNLGRIYARFTGYAEEFKSAIDVATNPMSEIQNEFKSNRRSFIDQLKTNTNVNDKVLLTSIDKPTTEIAFDDFLNLDFKTNKTESIETDDFLGEKNEHS